VNRSNTVAPTQIRQLMTLTETAQALRKTDSQLRWLIHERKAPPHAKIGGRILFDARAVARWIDEQFDGISA